MSFLFIMSFFNYIISTRVLDVRNDRTLMVNERSVHKKQEKVDGD